MLPLDTQQLKLHDLGLIDYPAAYTFQKKVVQDVIAGHPPALILCEHRPVFTLGRIATEQNFLIDQKAVRQAGATIERIDRGGEVTFHGPGQLVAYPILNLNHYGRDLKVYLGKLEQVAVDLLRQFGIVASTSDGQRGVWVQRRKIVSIGIGVRKWVSFHGLAINVNPDLRFFEMIKPCGLDVAMTSMARELGDQMSLSQIKQALVVEFCKNFGLENS